MRTLRVNTAGNGHGAVRSLAGGIDSGVDSAGQSHDYPRTTQVDLLATPAPDSFFAGWSGDGSNITLPGHDSLARHTNMWEDRTITATFNLGAWVKADLVVQQLKFVAGSCRIEFVVKNIGALRAGASKVHLKLQQVRDGGRRPIALAGGIEELDLDVPALLPGQWKSFSHGYAVVPPPPAAPTDPTRLISVLVVADAGGSVAETSESNNRATISGSLVGGCYQ